MAEEEELQNLLDEYCVKISLRSHPPNRIPTQANHSNDDDDGATTANWTPQDTQKTLKDVSFDTHHLGLKLYHTNPIQQINQACQSSEKMFVDYEFCVHEDAFEVIENENLTPGIITPQNVDDFAASGKQNGNARIRHFIDRARCDRDDGGSGRHNRWTWKRASSMPGKQLFAEDGSNVSICAKNVIQGRVGNCGFCSGFASLAARFPNLVRQVFGVASFEADNSDYPGPAGKFGAFSVCIYPQGKKRYLLLDDYLVSFAASTKSPTLHSLNKNDTWIRLLEKTFIKIQSSIASLDGYYKFNSLYRHPARALQLITGSPLAIEVHFRTVTVDDIYSTLQATEGKYGRVAHCRKKIDGLIAGHAYSLLWMGTIGGVRLACVRNPHGTRSYQGEFGRGTDSWNSDVAKLVSNKLRIAVEEEDKHNSDLGYLQDLLSPHEEEDNGVFLIRFDKFVKCFPTLTLVGPLSHDDDKAVSTPPSPEFAVTECLHRLEENMVGLGRILESADSFVVKSRGHSKRSLLE